MVLLKTFPGTSCSAASYFVFPSQDVSLDSACLGLLCFLMLSSVTEPSVNEREAQTAALMELQ